MSDLGNKKRSIIGQFMPEKRKDEVPPIEKGENDKKKAGGRGDSGAENLKKACGQNGTACRERKMESKVQRKKKKEGDLR